MSLDFTQEEHQALRDLARAGSAGLVLGEELPTSTAIRFELTGLAQIRTQEGGSKAVVTRKGEAFLHRVVR